MRFVLLGIENAAEADDLLHDIAAFPASPLRTPTHENAVYATVLVATEQVVRPGQLAAVPNGRPVPGVRVTDPEKLLSVALYAALRLSDPRDRELVVDDVAGDLARAVNALDAHLEAGGRLPASWSGARP